MKRLTLVLYFVVFCVFTFVWGVNHSQAEVYGYNLKISVLDGDSPVLNGSTVSKSDVIGGKLKLVVEVTDPSKPNSVFDISKWEVAISSSNPSEVNIASGAGFWSLDNIQSSQNTYKGNISMVDGESLDKYFATISAKANVLDQSTNKDDFKIVISDSPTNSSTSAQTNIVNSSNIKSGNSLFASVRSLLKDISESVTSILSYIGIPTSSHNLFLILLAIIILIVIWPLSRLANTVTLFSFGDAFAYATICLVPLHLRKPKWGVVVEGSSGIALPYTQVVLLDEKNRQLARTRTDRNGIYGFSVESGNYKLNFHKNGFVGNNNMKNIELQVNVQDSQKELFISPVEFKLSHPRQKRSIIYLFDFLEAMLVVALFIIILFGMIHTINNLIGNHSQSNIVTLIAFLVILLFSLEEFAKKIRRGRIPQEKMSKSISFAVVRLLNKRNNHLIKTAITNKNGSFSSFIRRGKMSYEISPTS